MEFKYTVDYIKKNKVGIFIKTQDEIDALKKLDCVGFLAKLKDYPQGFYTVPITGSWALLIEIEDNYEVVTAKEIIKNNKVEKKLIGYKAKNSNFFSAIEKVTNSNLYCGRSYNFEPNYAIKKTLEELGVLDLWCDKVFESEEVKIKMGTKPGFELKKIDGQVFYKEENITKAVKELQEKYKNFQHMGSVGGYYFKIHDILISKTGCITQETLLSEWMAIKL